MSHMPGFASAERAWENKNPFDGADACEDGDCHESAECLGARAQGEADEYADMV